MQTSGPIEHEKLARIRDLGERSMRRASEALTTLLGHPVRLAVVGIVPLADADGLLEEASGDAATSIGLDFQIAGQAGGNALILFPNLTVFRILGTLLGRPTEPHELDVLERSAIQELGNILASSFLSELGNLTHRRFMHSVPQVHLHEAHQRMREMLASVHARRTEVVVIQARFEDPARRLEGGFFVLPEIAALLPADPQGAGSQA
jgi:chemotaxis protein CheC